MTEDEPDPLQPFIERGRKTALAILAQSDMLRADQMAARLGLSQMALEAMRVDGRLIALPHPDGSCRFPDWQIDDQGRPYTVIQKLQELFATSKGLSQWSVYRFLLLHHGQVDGQTGIAAVRAGRSDEVVMAAGSMLHGDFS